MHTPQFAGGSWPIQARDTVITSTDCRGEIVPKKKENWALPRVTVTD
jgi:hypothetical protein